MGDLLVKITIVTLVTLVVIFLIISIVIEHRRKKAEEKITKDCDDLWYLLDKINNGESYDDKRSLIRTFRESRKLIPFHSAGSGILIHHNVCGEWDKFLKAYISLHEQYQ